MKSAFLRAAASAELGPRKGAAVLMLILLMVGVRSVLIAIAKPFWFDELCTLIVSRLPSPVGIWQALEHGADPQPPAYYIAEHLARQLLPDDHVGYRILSILGALIAIVCVYFFLSRRVSRLSALVAAALVLWTPLVAYYATEARPYALVVGCFSAAILAWQRIDDSKLYAFAMAIALAAAVSLHYYAIFAWSVFLIAEMSIVICKRRFRAIAWASMVVGALPVILVAPLVQHVRQYFGPHFFATPSFKTALFAHDFLFNLNGHWGPFFAIGITVVLLALNRPKSEHAAMPGERNAAVTRVPVEEMTLALMLLWLPFIVYAGAKLAHGGLLERYMMPAILGAALAVGYLIERVPAAGRELLLLLLVLGYASGLVGPLNDALHGSLLEQRTEASHELDEIAIESREPALPIVISDEDAYLTMAYYSPASSQSRMFFIADPASAVAYTPNRSDTVDLNVLALSHYYPLQVEDYAGFLAAHREFVLVAYYQDPEFEWVPYRLVHDGYKMMLLSSSAVENYDVFKVTARP